METETIGGEAKGMGLTAEEVLKNGTTAEEAVASLKKKPDGKKRGTEGQKLQLLSLTATHFDRSLVLRESMQEFVRVPERANIMMACLINFKPQFAEWMIQEAMRSRGYPDWVERHCIPLLLLHQWIREGEETRNPNQDYELHPVANVMSHFIFSSSLAGAYDRLYGQTFGVGSKNISSQQRIMRCIGHIALQDWHAIAFNLQLKDRFKGKRVFAFGDVVQKKGDFKRDEGRMVACLDGTKGDPVIVWLPLETEHDPETDFYLMRVKESADE